MGAPVFKSFVVLLVLDITGGEADGFDRPATGASSKG